MKSRDRRALGFIRVFLLVVARFYRKKPQNIGQMHTNAYSIDVTVGTVEVK